MSKGSAFCLLGIVCGALVFANPAENLSSSPAPFTPFSPLRENDNPLDQGGETCADATVISSLPYCDTGTTLSHVNNYVPPCLTSSTAPDVVYRHTPAASQVVSVSLCGSAYNTVLHIWRGCPTSGGVLVCCNDNTCGLQSCCANITLLTGQTYYFIVDGSGAEAGNYQINVISGAGCPGAPCGSDSCIVECPSGSTPENEPCPNFPDDFNGGCNASSPVFTPIQCGQTVCGTSTVASSAGRDTDWYSLTLSAPDSVSWCVRAEFPVEAMIMQPGPNGCADRDTLARITAPPCSTVCLRACLGVGSYALYVAPNTAVAFACADYVAELSCSPCPPPDTCPYPSQDNEPNNTCASGSAVVPCPGNLCGFITPDDGDYYQLVIATDACATVTIDVYGDDTPGWYPFGRGLDPNVCLYNATCSELVGCDYDSGTGNDAHLLTACLPAGTYKFRVGSDNGTNGPYVLALTCQACSCAPNTCPYVSRDQEPANNSCVSSNQEVACNDTLCGSIQALGDEDWYLLQVPSTPCGQVTIDVLANDTPGWWPFGQGLNPRVWIYSADCAAALAFDDNGGTGNDAHLISPCLSTGLYHIRIDGTGAVAPTSGPYILTVHCTSCQCPQPCQVQCNGTPEGEPCPNLPDNYNSGCTSGLPHFQPIGTDATICGTSIVGEVAGPDEDWFSFTLNWGSVVVWCVRAEFPVQTGLYAPGPGQDPCAGFEAIVCGTAEACSTVCVTECLPPGTYAARVVPVVPGVMPCTPYVANIVTTICTPEVCEVPDSLVVQVPAAGVPDLHLFWPPVPGADRYYVYRSPDSQAPPSPATFLAMTTAPAFTDAGVLNTPAAKHFYTIAAHCPYAGCP